MFAVSVCSSLDTCGWTLYSSNVKHQAVPRAACTGYQVSDKLLDTKDYWTNMFHTAVFYIILFFPFLVTGHHRARKKLIIQFQGFVVLQQN